MGLEWEAGRARHWALHSQINYREFALNGVNDKKKNVTAK